MVDQDGRTAIHSNLRISSKERERESDARNSYLRIRTSPVRTFVTPRSQPANGDDDASPFRAKRTFWNWNYIKREI